MLKLGVWWVESVCFKWRACSELILSYLYPIFPFGSCRACWERKPLCGQSAAIECGVFFTPCFCQPSLIRGLRLAEHCCSKSLFMPSSLILPTSLPPSLSLCSPFSAYNDGAQERKNIRCTQGRYFMQDDLKESAERKACQFKRSWLGDCSGLQDPHYGYSQGRPCILLRMNRVRWPVTKTHKTVRVSWHSV